MKLKKKQSSKDANTPKDKNICFKTKVILVISLCSRKEKTKKAPPPKKTEILLPMISKTLYYAINRVKGIHTPHHFYKTKYISCKSLKTPPKPAFVFLSFLDNLINSLCELTVNYERGYNQTPSSFSILLIFQFYYIKWYMDRQTNIWESLACPSFKRLVFCPVLFNIKYPSLFL